MATLEQLAEGIRRAHAAGNAEHVKVLGEAYRAMQAQTAQQPVDTSGPAFAAASKASQQLQGGPGVRPPSDLMTAAANTISGITNAIPVLGPLSQGIVDNVGGHISQAMGGDFNAPVQRREELIKRDPVAYGAGNVAGAIGSFGAMGATKLGADALGLGGKMLPGMLKAGLSNQGLYTADQYARGNSGVETLGNGLPALAGAGGRVVGDAIGAAGKGIASAVTGGAQRRITDAAIKGGAPAAADLKSAATQMFESSTGGKPLMISDTSYFRFLGGVKQVADKFRINVDNDQQSVGLLNTLMRIADDTASGVRVDMKDLHLVRQLAADVAQGSRGRDKAFGTAVIKQMDEFIQTLKPSDILGGANPSQAANDLMLGISTWARASKVGVIEEAVTKAGTYKSGLENGLRLQFQGLLRNPESRRLFTGPELQAIKDVANGTTKTNLVTLLGKFGFGTGGAMNMTGGTIGATIGGTLGSIFGPLGTAAGVGAAGLGAAAMRKLSEKLGSDAASRAAQVVATPGIRTAAQAPNLLLPAARPADYLVRGMPSYAGGR